MCSRWLKIRTKLYKFPLFFPLMLKAIIFEFDGVIHNTFHFHLNKIREMTSIDLSEEDYKAMHDGNFHSSNITLLHGTDWVAYRHFVRGELTSLKVGASVKEALLKLCEQHALFRSE